MPATRLLQWLRLVGKWCYPLARATLEACFWGESDQMPNKKMPSQAACFIIGDSVQFWLGCVDSPQSRFVHTKFLRNKQKKIHTKRSPCWNPRTFCFSLVLICFVLFLSWIILRLFKSGELLSVAEVMYRSEFFSECGQSVTAASESHRPYTNA